MSRSPRQKNTILALFRVVLLAFSVGVSLLFVELALRIVAPQPASWLALYRRHPVLPFYSPQPNANLHVDTGETRWTIVTDENGFRIDPDLEQSPTCEALWLGDSYAFGHGIDYEDSFVGLIDRGLPQVHTNNAAVAGYGPTQYRQTLEYLVDQGHEFNFLVVASYVGNDFHDTKWSKDQSVAGGIVGNKGDFKSLLMRNLHLYRLAASVYHRISPRKQSSYAQVVDQLARPDAWNEPFLSDARSIYETEMTRIAEIGREQGAEVIFMTLPTRQAVASLRGEAPDSPATDDAASNHKPTLPVEKAGEILARINAPHLDTTPMIATAPTDEMFFLFDGHLTRKGGTAVAEAFLERFALECDPRRDAL